MKKCTMLSRVGDTKLHASHYRVSEFPVWFTAAFVSATQNISG